MAFVSWQALKTAKNNLFILESIMSIIEQNNTGLFLLARVSTGISRGLSFPCYPSVHSNFLCETNSSINSHYHMLISTIENCPYMIK